MSGRRAIHEFRTDRPEERAAVGALRLLDVLFARLYHEVEVQTPHRLPRDGPGILVCNHTSGLDPFLLQSVCPRMIVWMMAKEYAGPRIVRPFFRTIETILVERKGKDLVALREGIRALERGRVLGVFPEGRIPEPGERAPYHTGVAMIALKSGVPIYPAYLDGTQRRCDMLASFLTRQRAILRFGEPFTLPVGRHQDLHHATALIRAQVEALQGETERAKSGRFRLPVAESRR